MIGSVDYLEIWDAQAWQEYQQTHEENFSAASDEALARHHLIRPCQAGTQPVHRGLCPNRPWRTSPTPGSRSRTGTSVQGHPPASREVLHGGRPDLRPRARPAGPLRRTAHPGPDPRTLPTVRARPGRRHAGCGRPRRAVPHRIARPASDRAGPRPQRAGDRRRAAGAIRRPVHPVRTRYDGIDDALAECGYAEIGSVDGVLFDLGVSSMQLDRAERGFSYSHDAPLDMRMDPDLPLTAADILNTYDKRALAAHPAGVRRRALRQPHRRPDRPRRAQASPSPPPANWSNCSTTPSRSRPDAPAGIPAKRTFQALRIAVNGELDSLRSALPAALDALAAAGRIVVMAYQSLEDRIVKTDFAAATASRAPRPGCRSNFPATSRNSNR